LDVWAGRFGIGWHCQPRGQQSVTPHKCNESDERKTKMENIERTVTAQAGPLFKQVEAFCEDIFLRKVPPLPEKAKDLLVTITPFLAILSLIFTAFSVVLWPLLALLGVLATFLSALTLSGSGVVGSLIGIASSLIGLVLGLAILFYLATAISGLFNRRLSGWYKLFRARVLSVAHLVISLALEIVGQAFSEPGVSTVLGIGATLTGAAFSALIAALSFYCLFQIREKYL
jgi:hypothetical protein